MANWVACVLITHNGQTARMRDQYSTQAKRNFLVVTRAGS